MGRGVGGAYKNDPPLGQSPLNLEKLGNKLWRSATRTIDARSGLARERSELESPIKNQNVENIQG